MQFIQSKVSSRLRVNSCCIFCMEDCITQMEMYFYNLEMQLSIQIILKAGIVKSFTRRARISVSQHQLQRKRSKLGMRQHNPTQIICRRLHGSRLLQRKICHNELLFKIRSKCKIRRQNDGVILISLFYEFHCNNLIYLMKLVNLDEQFNFIIKVMAYLIPLEVRDSSIHGKGLFALEDVPEGKTYWVFQDIEKARIPIKNHEYKPNVVYTKEELLAVHDLQRLNRILEYGLYYKDADVVIEFFDGSEFMNHFENPNSQVVFDLSKDYRKMKSYTLKAIKEGDEITENYANYLSNNTEWIHELVEKYSPYKYKLEIHLGRVQNKEETAQ